MHTWLNSGAKSDRGIGTGADGTAAIASLEGGVPFRLGRNWSIEPQGQIIWQRIRFDDTRDPFATINYESFDALTARLGMRLEGNTVVYGVPWQSFVSVDVWHNFSGAANVVFNDRNVATAIDGTSLELRGGLAMRMTANISSYASVGYTTSLDGKDRRSLGGNVGVRVRW
jgi:autotransporter family porin